MKTETIRIKVIYSEDSRSERYESLSADFPFRGYFSSPRESLKNVISRHLDVFESSIVSLSYDYSIGNSSYFTAKVDI